MLLFVKCLWGSSGQCLPTNEAIAEEQRLNINVDGLDIPLGIVQFPWATSAVDTNIYAIIVEEVLGIHTTFRASVDTSAHGLLQVAGCTCAHCGQPVCGAKSSVAHIMLGSWQSSFMRAEEMLKEDFPALLPERLGDMGYSGYQGSFLLQRARDEAFRSVQQAIEYYRSYNTDFDLSQFFSGIADIPRGRLADCGNGTEMWSTPPCQEYLRVTGDRSGVVLEEGGGCHASCQNGTWWLAPACRHDPRKCIPYVTGGKGWGLWEIMQKAMHHNMPLAVAVAADEVSYLSMPTDFQVQFYWWYPDSSFISLHPHEIVFPHHKHWEHLAGNYQSRSLEVRIEKFAWNGLDGLEALRAKEVAKRLSFTADQVTGLLSVLENETGMGLPRPEAAYKVACNWVRQSREIWGGWIPLRTTCLLGQGLSTGSAFVPARENATSCSWCSVGRYSAPVTDDSGLTYSCLACPAGQQQIASGQSACELCRPGSYKADEGVELCKDCPPGYALDLEGQTACLPCAAGKMASEPAQLTCQNCTEGTAAPEERSLSCTLCNRGTFADIPGSSNCTQCGEVLPGSTSSRGASHPAECQCPTKSYMQPTAGCVPCLEGLECPGGNAEPWQSAGYWVDVADLGQRQVQDYIIYRCRDTHQCPQGPLGTCAAGRHGPACNNCRDLHYPSSGGECLPCRATSGIPLIVCMCLAIAIMVFLVVRTRMEATTSHLTVVAMVLISGQTFTTIQTFGAVKQIQVIWPEQLLRIFEIFGVFVFDLNWLRLPCLMSADSPLQKFALSLLVYPTFVLLLLVICAGARLLGRPVNKMVAININGAFLLVFYISMTLTVMLPFQCRKNPSDFVSMAMHPGVRCFDSSEHMFMLLGASLGILVYPVGIAAWVIHATVTYKATARTIAGVELTRRFRFLFGRFKPECYYFGLVILISSGLVALIPILLVPLPALQVMVMAFLLVVGMIYQVWLQPWRTWLPNVTDTVLGVLRAIVVTGVAALLDDASQQMTVVICSALLTVFVCISLLLLALLGTAMYRRLCPTKPFGIFLCHHKAGAGALCRLMKMILAAETSSPVFLDSDHLNDLDSLFDTVRSEVANLVVVLSQKVLTRPWCAGEMVTAHRHMVPMVPLACDDFEDLDSEQLQDIVQGWSDEELALLLRCDMSEDNVVDAYEYLMSLPIMRMSRMQPLRGKESVMADLVVRCNLPISPLRALMFRSSQLKRSKTARFRSDVNSDYSLQSRVMSSSGAKRSARVLITGLVSDSEKLAACEIMQMELRKQLEVDVDIVRSEVHASEVMPTAEIFLVLWASGLLQDPTFARILLQATEQEDPPQFLTAVADSSFQFPTTDFFRFVENYGLVGLGPDEGPQLSAALQSLLSILSRPFDPLRSQSSIEEQVRELAGRARNILHKGQTNRNNMAVTSTVSMGSSHWNQRLSLIPEPTLPEEEGTEESSEPEGVRPKVLDSV